MTQLAPKKPTVTAPTDSTDERVILMGDGDRGPVPRTEDPGRHWTPDKYQAPKKSCCQQISSSIGEACGWLRSCACIYCIFFVIFLTAFPLYLKCLMGAPKPREYWDSGYDRFPVLENWTFVNQSVGRDNYKIEMSPIPTTWSGCNYSCGAAEVNFHVELTLKAPGYHHNVYPVILASEDFEEWWVAADRRQAEPSKFFAANDYESGNTHRLVTEQCSRKPDWAQNFEEPNIDFTSSPGYLLVCIAFKWDKVKKMRSTIDKYGVASDLSDKDIPEYCDVVGGSCGWACGSGATAVLDHCSHDGKILANKMFPTANFNKGKVSLRPCLSPTGADNCVTNDLPMSRWPCHNCFNQTRNVSQLQLQDDYRAKILALEEQKRDKIDELPIDANFHSIEENDMQVQQIDKKIAALQAILDRLLDQPSPVAVYQSLPQMEIILQDFNPEDLVGTVSPHAFVFHSSEGSGTWRHVHHDFFKYELPDPVTDNKTLATTSYLKRNIMEARIQNRLVLQAAECWSKRGPLYLVACAANQSTHKDNKELKQYGKVAPPPFNDRCVAVSGRCAYACMEQQHEMKYCDPNTGMIHMDKIQDDVPPRKNESPLLTMYIFVLLLGFTTKVLSLIPGLLNGYAHADPPCTGAMTKKLKYMAVCTPSGGESKACVLRNIIGAIAAMPDECECLYHVCYADEGHRHAHKVMLHVLNKIVRNVESRGNIGPTSALKRFMTKWCEDTCLWRLDQTGDGAKFMPDKKEFLAKDKSKEQLQKLQKAEQKLKNFSGETAVEAVIGGDKFKRVQKAFEMAALEKKGVDKASPAACGEIEKLAFQKIDADQEKNMELYKNVQVMKELIIATGKDGLPVKPVDNGADIDIPELIGVMNYFDQATDRAKRTMTLYWVEQTLNDTEVARKKPKYEDDCRSYPKNFNDNPNPDSKLCLHYIARAKPDEDKHATKTRHVTRGIWYYKLSNEHIKEREVDKDIEWRKSITVMEWLNMRKKSAIQRGMRDSRSRPDEADKKVPLRTSRGKAGGMNFTENYLWLYHRNEPEKNLRGDFLPALFSIADARHQFQPAFFDITVPYFFNAERPDNAPEVNKRVGFTQCPQFFPENEDDVDYLDTNNANFYRLSCMLRNCAGGVSSCGTNGTWLVEPREGFKFGDEKKDDKKHWEKPPSIWKENPQDGWVEQQVFHESCKIEDTASSLHSVIDGKHSQYINMRLSVGMAKEATDYLAALQRWAEGGVVLSLQVFLTLREGFKITVLWGALCLWVCFVLTVFGLIHYDNPSFCFGLVRLFSGDDAQMQETTKEWARYFTDKIVSRAMTQIEDWQREEYANIFFSFSNWVCLWLIIVVTLYFLTLNAWCWCKCSRKSGRSRRRGCLRCWTAAWTFPTNISMWIRLLITVENLTYFLWFWTAFFWVGFNYVSIFRPKDFAFEPVIVTFANLLLNITMYGLIISSCFRFFGQESRQFNQKWELTLTNIWRTTQLYYITAPMQLYSVIMGIFDFTAWYRYNQDISFWEGGDRGAFTKQLVKWWTTLLVIGVPIAWICIAAGVATELKDSVPSAIVCTFIGLDCVHPCFFLWLNKDMESLPKQKVIDNKESTMCGRCAVCCSRCWESMKYFFMPAWWRNKIRAVIFSAYMNTLLKWIGPLQNLGLMAMTFFFPQLGLTAALNLLLGLSR